MKNEIDIARRLIRVSNKIRQNFDASFTDSDITRTQAAILLFIARNSHNRDIFQRDIEAEFYIRRSSVTSVLNSLEEKGFIRRESVNEDARLKKLILTDKATLKLNRITELFEQFNDNLIKGISKEDIAYLDSLLERITDGLS